jgi:hypothetical protein
MCVSSFNKQTCHQSSQENKSLWRNPPQHSIHRGLNPTEPTCPHADNVAKTILADFTGFGKCLPYFAPPEGVSRAGQAPNEQGWRGLC